MSWNVFIIGHDALSKRMLPNLRHVEDYAFHELLSLEEVVHAEEYPFARLVSDALAQLERFPGPVDAIVGYWDFPTSGLLPVLRRERGLPGPSLEAFLKCEHKYWSRLEQARAVPECVPAFQALDPFDDQAVEAVEIDYPFWIKPVKAHSSHLGFRIENADQLREVLPAIRRGIGRFGRPFDEITALADLPAEVAAVTGHHCIAEAIISSGRQCTLEGYVQNGEVHLVGIVDSLRDATHSSVLLRYEYPSSLPDEVQERMLAITRRFLTRIGYDDGPFNIEYYLDEQTDRIWLLEINARISRSHAAIFQLVDGAPHFQVMVDVALGIAPRMPYREGRYPVAAKQMLRVFEDGWVRRVPTEAEIRRVEEAFPGTLVHLNVREGMRLSELKHQDSFSWELGVLFTGAQTREALTERIESCRRMLPFEIAPLSSPEPR
ncbi:acetyl-CoA carboxylase biotin carboxylase subunit family protein [Halomonas rhizosphaerae]|uniref:ATP-grasp domain-containing protein n=1 Tax=Halomonas rhizosphaerae TaxID=3043296 RepID=A0ABT6V6J8_9GAMM|nr:ATP-grasp domain-containing protein [Halomonas rhizosphaerae]MDI5892582.1 ATP-grasp domain-containing protein [Halomonas rhizosphaerae]